MNQFYIYNGKLVSNGDAVIHLENRSFRYGEGLFETMRLRNNDFPLWQYHWKRLVSSFSHLYFEIPVHFTEKKLKGDIRLLAEKNNCTENGRIRINFFKGDGGLWEKPSSAFNYIIQCWPIEQNPFQLNNNGLQVGLFTEGWKACDKYSNLKSNNYLLYVMAAQYAKGQKWNEAIVLNQYKRICDATIANIFFVKEDKFFTPNLGEGCVAGTMRQYLIDNMEIEEGEFTIEDLLTADELFFTNAFSGIRWVKSFDNKNYTNKKVIEIFSEFVFPLFS